jgi:hypothetical protein
MELGFQNILSSEEIGTVGSKTIHRVHGPLMFFDSKGRLWIVSAGFETDLASIPRIPVVWFLWGDRVHREGALHDFAYRQDSYYFIIDDDGSLIKVDVQISRSDADDLLKEAIESQSKSHDAQPWWISKPIWAGVRVGGWYAYHKMKVADKYALDCQYK